MADRLVVVLGAGASADSVSHMVAEQNQDWRPPLVRELFDPRFASILNDYRIAQSAAADIRRHEQQVKRQERTSLSIERFLREEYAGSPGELRRRKLLSLPPYLQDVLLASSVRHSPQPDNYDLLVSYIYDLIEDTDLNILLLTLNYDVVFDRCLDAVEPLRTLDDYVHPDRRWALIKLHGSVDWGRMVTDRSLPVEVLFNPPANLHYSSDIVLTRGALSELPVFEPPGTERLREQILPSFRERDVRPHGRTLLYPALSVPLGEEDELSCPHEHLSFLKQDLQVADGLHLLVIGYSAVDLEVLKILRETTTPIKSFGIVNRSLETAQDVNRRIHKHTGKHLGKGWVWESTFGGFVQRDGWDQYREHLNRQL